ncbi:Sphingolipid delta(4)-desaturase DES1 [Halotydeus destructor]|nr:Sphingolipid delta(4)-desaturase DES1 [Halotydeus destructor]
MGARVSRSDFEWVASDEPHATRRKLILSKYPAVKTLMGVDPNFKWQVLGLVAVQLVTFYALKDIKTFWILFLVAYFFVGVINHSLMLAVHEIAHCQAFGHNRVLANKLFGMVANLPIGLPMSVSFKKYHLKHHRYQGDDLIDTDIPSKFETQFFTNTFMKFIWVFLQPLFYSLRPFFVYPLPPEPMELVNLITQMSFNAFVVHTFGWHILWTMLGGSLIAMGMHPVAGHFISEHYIMFTKEDEKEHLAKGDAVEGVSVSNGKILIPETSSYYGPLNYVTFNVGYHVEHHDFPSIPGSRLPQLRKIAPEFYNNLRHHTSWTYVLYQYIMDPSVGPYARVKRETKEPVHSNGTNGLCKESNGSEKIKTRNY